MKVLIHFLWGWERNASVKASTLSYWASGLVRCVLTIWVTSQWNIFPQKKKTLSIVLLDQYGLYADMPVSFIMLSTESPWWVSNLLSLVQIEWLACWTLWPWWTEFSQSKIGTVWYSRRFRGRHVVILLWYKKKLHCVCRPLIKFVVFDECISSVCIYT